MAGDAALADHAAQVLHVHLQQPGRHGRGEHGREVGRRPPGTGRRGSHHRTATKCRECPVSGGLTETYRNVHTAGLVSRSDIPDGEGLGADGHGDAERCRAGSTASPAPDRDDVPRTASAGAGSRGHLGLVMALAGVVGRRPLLRGVAEREERRRCSWPPTTSGPASGVEGPTSARRGSRSLPGGARHRGARRTTDAASRVVSPAPPSPPASSSTKPHPATARASHGSRAMSIPIDPARAVGGRLGAGDRVDVLFAGQQAVSIIVADVPVLAVDPRGRGGIGESSRPFTVTIVVNAAQSQLVAAAVADGEISELLLTDVEIQQGVKSWVFSVTSSQQFLDSPQRRKPPQPAPRRLQRQQRRKRRQLRQAL